MSGAWVNGRRLRTDGAAPLTRPPAVVTMPPANHSTPLPTVGASKEKSMPPPPVILVPMTQAQVDALAALPELVAILRAGPPAAATAPAAPATPRDSVPTAVPDGLVPHPLNKDAAPISAALSAQIQATMAKEAAKAAPSVASAAKAMEAAANAGAPIPTLDDLRTACATYANAHGGTGPALARMAEFKGLKTTKVGTIPEADRAAFIAWMGA